MSLKSKQNKQLDIPSQLQTFEVRLNRLKESQSLLSQQSKRNQANFDIKQLTQISTNISGALSTYQGGDRIDLENKFNDLLTEFKFTANQISQTIQQLAAQEQAARQEEAEKAAEQGQQAGLSQQAMDDQTAQVQYVERESVEILQQVQQLNEVQNLINDKIVESHEVVVRVDNTVEATKEEMVKGNEELDKAKKDQPKCRI